MDLSRETIRRRMKRLTDEGWLTAMLVPEWKLEAGLSILWSVSCVPGMAERVLDDIQGMEGVQWAILTDQGITALQLFSDSGAYHRTACELTEDPGVNSLTGALVLSGPVMPLRALKESGSSSQR